jgi:alpha-ketoglutarate-dependent dioxygenase alkB family protein 2
MFCQYGILFTREQAKALFAILEKDLVYDSPQESAIRFWGKTSFIRRQQMAFGTRGLKYRYSGNKGVRARPWHPAILPIKWELEKMLGVELNFALVNRYRDGKDRVNWHQDNEDGLNRYAPIVSISLGAERAFHFLHESDRYKRYSWSFKVNPIGLILEAGSILVLNPPTNHYWYHAVLPEPFVTSPRINITFRHMLK